MKPWCLGTHHTKTWFTTGEVAWVTCEDTYRVKIGPGQFKERHETQLRAHEPDILGKCLCLDFTSHEANLDEDCAEQGDYTVDNMLAQHPNPSAAGRVEFKVRWRDYGPSRDTLEAVSSCVPRNNTLCMEYVLRHKIQFQVSVLATLIRVIEAEGDRSPP